jgi:hypothetical protein
MPSKERPQPPEPPRPHQELRNEQESFTEAITSETPLGGARYPFLAATGREWSILPHPLGTPIRYPQPTTFSMLKPTLRWINGSRVVDAFVNGLTTEQFLAQTGLTLSLEKGGYTLSKRLSRLMRPHFIGNFFPATEVNIAYRQEVDPQARKIWDGAGLISRRFLERLTIASGVNAAKRAALLRQLRYSRRMEFTLLTERGQDKGHAIVADELPTDFVLPLDTKPEVKLINGECFIGIDFVHAQTHMQLDIQSLINLHPCFQPEPLAHWLEEDGQRFIQAVISGQVSEQMQRLDRFSSLEDIEHWPLRAYLASGGQPCWFADITRNLMNQHLDQLRASSLGKLHLPIPGGRFYVMPMGVGQQAGIDHTVPRGQVRLDKQAATAWVNDADWLQLENAQTGIAELLGGADNDDALWVHGFTDYDGEAKVLCWRSPNQVGEYVVLRPTLGSAILEWQTPDGNIAYPAGDSRLLPPRKDSQEIRYQGVVDLSTAGKLGEGKPYSIQAMSDTIQRALANAGALGMYCNLLMVSKAITGGLPIAPPAELETVIDGSVKTGVDLSAVKTWCYGESKRLVESQTPIPAILASRILGTTAQHPVTLTENHWLDGLIDSIKHHIRTFEQQRDVLVSQAMPPAVVFDHAFDEPEFIELGAGLQRAYYSTIQERLRQHTPLTPDDYDHARHEAEAYLKRFPPQQHTSIVRGAIVSGYLRDKPSDRVVWLSGEKTPQGRAPGIAQITLRALREIGVLQELGETTLGILVYPGAVTREAVYSGSIGITGVWFNWLRRWQHEQGQAPFASMSVVPKPRAAWAKQQVAALTQTEFRDLSLIIQVSGDHTVALTEAGDIFGYISTHSAAVVPEGKITLGLSLCQDGNLQALWRPTEADAQSR